MNKNIIQIQHYKLPFHQHKNLIDHHLIHFFLLYYKNKNNNSYYYLMYIDHKYINHNHNQKKNNYNIHELHIGYYHF